MESTIWFIISVLVIFIVSALPLHFSVKLFNGKTHLLKSVIVNLFVAILAIVISFLVPFGSIVAFVLLIFIYRELFRISLLKSFFVWIMQFIFMVLIIFVFSIAGISIPVLNLIF